MGRRSINTTKSGKYMNPTDQARKEARKRELKKNKKQRMMVRQAVLKGKDPYKLLEDMEQIDKMEFDPTQPPKLNEKVLKDKRKKLKETFDRVFRLYEKEDPTFSIEIKKAESEYNKRRQEMQAYYEQVRLAEQVQLDQIPLPDAPSIQPIPSQIPLPLDIPLGLALPKSAPQGILKKPSKPALPPQPPLYILRKRKPPGPPPGPPPPLSDDEEEIEKAAVPAPMVTATVTETENPPPAKQRKIRFEDDDKYDPEDPEKDSRPKFKPAVSPLQVRMLQMAGQVIPMVAVQDDKQAAAIAAASSAASAMEVDQDEVDKLLEDIKAAQDIPVSAASAAAKTSDASHGLSSTPGGSAALPPGAPPGPPPGLPPGPPPGLPPMMFRPPPMRGAPPGAPPRMLPPGPPPGRPPGIPPGPPPGLPPNLRAPPPRLPAGPPGVPPPRLLRPPQVPPPGVPPMNVPSSIASNPNVLSAPPSIMKPPLKSDEDKKKGGATIEAKPQIKNPIGDVMRFMPTTLRVKRNQQKGRSGRDDPTSIKQSPAVAPQTKDDAYENFLKEMQGLL